MCGVTKYSIVRELRRRRWQYSHWANLLDMWWIFFYYLSHIFIVASALKCSIFKKRMIYIFWPILRREHKIFVILKWWTFLLTFNEYFIEGLFGAFLPTVRWYATFYLATFCRLYLGSKGFYTHPILFLYMYIISVALDTYGIGCMYNVLYLHYIHADSSST